MHAKQLSTMSCICRSISTRALFALWLSSATWMQMSATVRADAPGVEQSQLVPRQILALVHAPEVQQELKLNSSQKRSLRALFAQIDGEWFRSRNLPPDKRLAAMMQLESRLWEWLQKQTTDAQQARLKQLEYRAQGIRMLLREDLRQQLALDADQQRQITELAQATQQATAKLYQASMQGQVSEELKQAVQSATQAEYDVLETVVKPEQRNKLAQLLGKPFDTTGLKRIYPMAPELIPVQHWINSDPLTLKSLRGKVVLLHFYAFQCHNCHANFGHYRDWDNSFGEDVVVIGIQTPETSMERDPDAVRRAAADRELEFPILVDLQSENWKAWANTMWPTVYVIDKNGYIRHWWQGELNWNGATADQTIETLVNELLQEEIET